MTHLLGPARATIKNKKTQSKSKAILTLQSLTKLLRPTKKNPPQRQC